MRFSLALALCLAALTIGCASVVGTSGRVVIQDEQKNTVDISINTRDRALIEDYYADKKRKKGLPPGLAKRGGALPPGLAKRDTLPPGLQSESLPYDLERQLTPLSGNYVRVRINQDVVLMEKRTRVVLDVVYGVAI
jgi:hypothetical protein